MSATILDSATQAERLETFIGGFQRVAEETTAQVSKQKKVNDLLDSILDAQGYLARTNAEFAEMLPGFAQFFWYTNPDANTLANLRKLVDLMNEVSEQMQTFFKWANSFFYTHKLARTEVFRYRDYAHQLKELAIDLEQRHFTLADDDEFTDIMQQLEAL